LSAGISRPVEDPARFVKYTIAIAHAPKLTNEQIKELVRRKREDGGS